MGLLTPPVLSLLYDKALHSLKYCEEIYLCVTIFTYILCTHTMDLMYPWTLNICVPDRHPTHMQEPWITDGCGLWNDFQEMRRNKKKLSWIIITKI